MQPSPQHFLHQQAGNLQSQGQATQAQQMNHFNRQQINQMHQIQQQNQIVTINNNGTTVPGAAVSQSNQAGLSASNGNITGPGQMQQRSQMIGFQSRPLMAPQLQIPQLANMFQGFSSVVGQTARPSTGYVNPYNPQNNQVTYAQNGNNQHTVPKPNPVGVSTVTNANGINQNLNQISSITHREHPSQVQQQHGQTHCVNGVNKSTNLTSNCTATVTGQTQTQSHTQQQLSQQSQIQNHNGNQTVINHITNGQPNIPGQPQVTATQHQHPPTQHQHPHPPTHNSYYQKGAPPFRLPGAQPGHNQSNGNNGIHQSSTHVGNEIKFVSAATTTQNDPQVKRMNFDKRYPPVVPTEKLQQQSKFDSACAAMKREGPAKNVPCDRKIAMAVLDGRIIIRGQKKELDKLKNEHRFLQLKDKLTWLEEGPAPSGHLVAFDFDQTIVKSMLWKELGGLKGIEVQKLNIQQWARDGRLKQAFGTDQRLQELRNVIQSRLDRGDFVCVLSSGFVSIIRTALQHVGLADILPTNLVYGCDTGPFGINKSSRLSRLVVQHKQKTAALVDDDLGYCRLAHKDGYKVIWVCKAEGMESREFNKLLTNQWDTAQFLESQGKMGG